MSFSPQTEQAYSMTSSARASSRRHLDAERAHPPTVHCGSNITVATEVTYSLFSFSCNAANVSIWSSACPRSSTRSLLRELESEHQRRSSGIKKRARAIATSTKRLFLVGHCGDLRSHRGGLF